MANENAVSVEIRANVSQYTAAMKEAAGTTSGAAKQMRDEIAGIGQSASQSHAPLSGFRDVIRDYRSEVSQEHRMTMVLARDIADMGIAGKGAAAEVLGLVSAFTVGNGIGVGIELVKMTVKAVNELGEAEKKAAEEMKKFIEDLVGGTDRIKANAEIALMSLRGASKAEIEAHKELKPLLDDRKKHDEEIAVLEGNIAAARDEDADRRTAASVVAEAQDVAQLERLRTERAELQKNIEARQLAIGGVATAQIGVDAKDEAEKRRQLREKEAQEREADLDDQVRNYHGALNAQSKAEYDASKAIEKMLQGQQEYRANLQKKREKDQDDENKKLEDGVKRSVAVVGSAFSSTFKSLITGSKSAGDAMIGMAQSFAEAAIDGLVKVAEEAVIGAFTKKAVEKVADISATQGNIAVAVSGAAASMAGIPLVGPGLAMAAAAAMEADLEAMTAPLLSAAGGLDRVPSGGAFIMAHAEETVLSAEFANPLRKLLASLNAGGGGGGGGDVHVHIHAWDGQDVQRVVEGAPFQRAVRESMRNGRWPEP